MDSYLKKHTLVLNKSWMAIHTTTVKNALLLLIGNAAVALNPTSYETFTFDQWVTQPGENHIRTYKLTIPIPEIIVLTKYNKIPLLSLPFSRPNLYNRDDYQCQYCCKKPGSKDLSIDHIIPRSKGGATSWENCVLACTDCNRLKGDKFLRQTGMKLIKTPMAPKWTPIAHVKKKDLNVNWLPFLGKYMDIKI